MMFSFPWQGLVLVLPLARALSLTGGCPDNFRVKEFVPHNPIWIKHSPAPRDHDLILNIGLSHSNFDLLETRLLEVSDPFHTRYGQHLTKAEIEGLIAPHPPILEAVNAWLACHGITEADIIRSPAKDWATVKIPVGLAEKMLNTTYHVWRHAKSSDTLIRTSQYSLPQFLHEHIDVIQPTTMFSQLKQFKTNVHSYHTVEEPDESPDPQGLAVAAGLDPACNHTITISCLQQLYGTAGYTPAANNGNQIGVTGFLGEFANFEDLQLFYADQTPVALGSNFSVFLINDEPNSQNASDVGIEANLDTQFAFGLSNPIPSTFYSTGGSPPFIPSKHTVNNTNEPFLEWLNFVLSQDRPPWVISTSYGDDEQTVPRSYAKRICQGFAQLGARGITLLFGSGDGGVGDGNPNPNNQTCITNDGLNTTRFLPSFPPSCPFVTAVGGTFNILPEIAAPFSGGGFSNYFPQPQYQRDAVQRFLSNPLPGTYDGLFNRSGRAYPDISAQSVGFRIIFGGQGIFVDGTSASTPAVAGIIALLNDARIALKKPPLGFLNPLLYSKGIEGLTDIKSGNAPGCGTPGFNATEAWDPVTGLGTLNFPKLLEIATVLT